MYAKFAYAGSIQGEISRFGRCSLEQTGGLDYNPLVHPKYLSDFGTAVVQ